MRAMDRFASQLRQLREGRTPRHGDSPSTGRVVTFALLAGAMFVMTGFGQEPGNSLPPPPGVGVMPPPPVRLVPPVELDRPVLPPPTAAPAPVSAAPATGRPVVSDILIRDNRHVSSETIKNQLKTRVGKEYVEDILQEDVRALYATRQFENVLADKFEDGPGRIKVVIIVRDYPSVIQKVTYIGGGKLSDDDLTEITGVRKGMPCNPIANRVACQNIVRRFHEEGRFLSSCDLLKGGSRGDTEVIFSITAGPTIRIAAIEFTGNQFATGGQLQTHMQSSRKFLGRLNLGGTYNGAMLDHDQNELIRYYRGFGYHDVRIGRELRYLPDGHDLVVVFHVREGVRYRVGDTPHVHGSRSLTPESLEAPNKMRGNELYDQFKIDQDLARIKDHLGTQGREAQVRAVSVYSQDKPGVVQVRYEVEERPPARVGQIYTVGNDRTRDNVILRQVLLFPGQVFNYPAIRESENRLARLSIFESSPDGAVKPTISVIDNPNDPDAFYKDILVSVQEASTGSLMFGLGVNSDSGLTGSIVLNERNFDLFRLPRSFDDLLNGTAFRGAGQELRIEAVPGTQLQRYTVSLREPFLFDSPYSLTVSGFYYQRTFNEYNEDRLGGRVSIGRKINDLWSIVATERVENVNVSNVAPYAPADYRNVVGDNLLIGSRIGAVRDTRNSVLRPTEGSLFDIGGEYVTGDYNFPLVTAELTKYWTVFQRADNTGKHVLSVHSQVGWAGTTTPVFERYFAGGFRSIRGFQFRGVSPDVNGFKVGGDFMVLNSLEYQVPVTAKGDIAVVGFVDSGSVSPRVDDISTYRVSAGFGVRFVVPMLGPMPIALDFGFPIVRANGDQTQVFNFFMGWTR